MLHLKRMSQWGPKRLMSTVKSTLEHLKGRTLIKVSGNEVGDFLQGLITNDMTHLSSGPGCMYSMFLNTRGRIMYDTIIYRPTENDTYFVECDKSAVSLLEKHLKMYRVRRKIEVRILEDEYQIYCIFKTDCSDTESVNNLEIIENGMPQSSIKIHKNLLIYKDPRLKQLGSRIITQSGIDVVQETLDLPNLNLETATINPKNYKWLRYSLGVGEGVEDLSFGTSFPLECNCDYLHGVSFHKGCYVGQELTARVHHTGMVRKRLMPLNFVKIPTKTPEESIIHQDVNLGKYRGLEGDKGLALLRIEKVLKFDEICVGDGVAKVSKPFWWPQELSKDKIIQNVKNQ